MYITEIREYDKKRKKISLDNGLIFLLYKGECARLRLREGGELSESDLRKIYDDILRPRVKKRALYYLRTSDKTEREVRKKLKEGFYPDELIDYAIDFLKSHSFVDDERYAEAFVEAKKGRASKREIISKLRQKGVETKEIEAAIESMSIEDEYEPCLKKLRSYMRGKDLKDSKDKARAYRYLLSKGYGYEVASRALDTLESEHEI